MAAPTGPARDKARAAALAEVSRWETLLADQLHALIDRQQGVVLARLQGTKARKNTRHWAPGGTKALDPKYVVDVPRWVREAVAATRGLFRRLFRAVVDAAFRRYAAAAQPPSPADEARPADPRERPVARTRSDLVSDDDIERMVEARADQVAEAVEAAAERVQERIAAAEQGGLTMQDIVDRVRETYEQDREVWAGNVAASQTVGALNEASLATALAAGVGRKQWLSAHDTRVRPTHRAADGQVVDIDDEFAVGAGHLGFPGDPSGPVEEWINCRCTLLFPLPEAPMYVRPSSPVTAGKKFDPRQVRDRNGRWSLIGAAAGALSGSGGGGRSGSGSKPGGGRGGAALPDGAPDARAKVADVMGSNAPDPKKSKVITSRDSSGSINGFVVWQDGDDPDFEQGDVRGLWTSPTAPAGTEDGLRKRAYAADSKVPLKDKPGPSGNQTRDAARVERLQAKYMRDRKSTEDLYMDDEGRYTPERRKQHEEVIDHFLNAPGVKSENKMLVLGGLPGAGKTTVLRSDAAKDFIGADVDEYVMVNPDEVKGHMLDKGMVPDWEGLTPMEAGTLYHEEASVLSKRIMARAKDQGKNIAFDATLKSEQQAGHADAPGYDRTLVYVDVSIDTSKERAVGRYQRGDRFVPTSYIETMRSGETSKNTQTFDKVKGNFDKWIHVDNNGKTPKVIGDSGKKARA